MPLNWDDDDEEELTEIEYKKRSSRVVIHDENTTPMGEPIPVARRETPREGFYQTPPPLPVVLKEPKSTPPPRVQALGAYSPAPLRDRFAAFFIDSCISFYLYFLVGFGLLKFFGMPGFAVLHQGQGRLMLHLGITSLAVFFYYVSMESVFGATLGKLFCRLRVIEENGQSASLGNVFIRNFLRIVDYPLFFLIAVIAMESSPLNQRLGDRAAKTIVIKKTRRHFPTVNLAHTPLASTLSRIFAECVDLVLSLLLVYGIFLLARPSHPLLSYVILISLPLIFVAYYTALEFLTGTSPGKTLFGRQVVLEHGEPPDGTGALMRNLFRPLDYLLGYPLMTLSRRKQRLGDMAADTLVIVKPVPQKAWLGSAIAVFAVLVVAYFGFKNPNNLIRAQYGMGPIEGLKVFLPGPRVPAKQPLSGPTSPSQKAAPEKAKSAAPLPATTSDKLTLVEFYFATGPAPGQIRKDATFRSGDLIFLFFKVQGFQLNEQQEASVREDLRVEDPEGKVLVSQPNVVELTKAVKENNPSMLFANQVKMPREAPLGKYRAVFTVYDTVAQTQFSFEKTFDLQ